MIDPSIIDEASQWLDYQGVEGVAEGKRDGKVCILVLSSVDPSQLSSEIPKSYKGYPVVIEYTGEIKAF